MIERTGKLPRSNLYNSPKHSNFMKEKVIEILENAIKELGISPPEKLNNLIEKPKDFHNGDFAFPCFSLAKEMKTSPHDIAIKLREIISNAPEEFEQIQVAGPYINFYLNRKLLAKNLIKEIKKLGNEYGKNESGELKVVAIDMSAPNIAKPFGIGHLRSTIIGDSISKIANFNGYKTVKINYLGDWGTQFGKLIYAFKKWGDEKKLKEDPINHLQNLYVKVNSDEKYDEFARGEFKKLEEGDKENLELWKRFKELSIKKFDELYELLGVNFDVISGESKYNNKMDSVIKLLEKKKLLTDSEGAKIVDLEKYDLGVALIQKSDGASLYATRDLAAAINRREEYKADILLYEVGSEQTLHFNQVFKVLELMGFDWAKNCRHVAHGLYLGKDGKKFSTRQGKTVYLKDILEEVLAKAEKNILDRDKKISKKELKLRAHKIAISAIKFGDLKNYRENGMVFDIDRFLAFEGDTGPYCQYSYARASSILRKAQGKEKIILPEEFEEKEVELILKLNDFKKTISDAFNSMNPAIIANYSYSLSQTFNEFYHSCPVIDSIYKGFRLELTDSFRQVLKNSLNLLGIETIEVM
jgi:arginyl-tRNA synthetase